MRTTSIVVPSTPFPRPRTPAVIVLAHDLKMLIHRLSRIAKNAKQALILPESSGSAK